MSRLPYPELLADQVAVQVIDNIWVLILPHHKNLVDYQLFLRLLLQVHLLDGNLATGGDLYGNENCS